MKPHYAFLSLLIAAMMLLFFAETLYSQTGIQPEDFYKTVFVDSSEISPNGDLIAFTKTIVKEKDNSRHSEVWMQKIRNGRSDGEPFRFTDPSVQSSNPQWSPDGELLSIQSRRRDDSNTVRFLRVTAPGGEAFQIEGLDRTPVWSPDGEQIAFVREPEAEENDDNDKRTGWIAPGAITTTLDSSRFDGRVITQMRYKSDGRSSWLPHPSVNPKRQLHIISAEGGEPEIITDLPFHVSDIEWSADGSHVYFSGDPEEDDEYNTDFTRNLYMVNVENGEHSLLMEMDGSQSSPTLSPNGSFLTFTHSPERGALTNVMVVSLGNNGMPSGEPVNITEEWDLSPDDIHWSPNNEMIRFSAQTRGNSHLFEVSRSGGEVQQVTLGDRRLSSISTTDDGRYMAYTSTDAVTPAELFISRNNGNQEVQLTNFNAEWMAERTINPAEQLTWTVEDGTEIEGWVIKPVGYEEGNSYPLILKIHGGPHSYYGNTWFQTFHVLSASGFFVFYPNPRGSSSYGHDFTYATIGQWGFMDEEDFMTGLDAVFEKYSDVDPERVGVSGGSYGGFMTNWLTARFPDRFAAANTSRSISNWESWYGTSDAQGLTEFEFGGMPWEERELYRELSPISYVENVTAPTLIIHSEEDWRTPIGDAEQWYISLKKMEVPVEFVRYPRSSHGLSRTGEPWLLVDRLERIRSWFDHWLN
ncbi:S9 family peptidase [soil metagenome]